jgi:hypothetical protein
MGEPVPREKYPVWVKVILWGLPGRGYAVACAWFSLLLAVGWYAYLFWAGHRVWSFGLLFLAAALLYWLSVRWVDRHGSWERRPPVI